MVYLFALIASLANALTSVLQRMGVEDAPAESTLRLTLLTHALRRRIWVLGLSMMIVSFLTQAVALHVGRLSQVQPILTTELLFLVFILSTWFRFRVGLREWAGTALAAGGLAGFLVFAQPGGGNLTPKTWEWATVGTACVFAMVVAVVLALRGPRWWRAAMFGTASAIGFAFTAALTKIVTNFFSPDWVNLFRHWETYGLALAVAGLTLGALLAFRTRSMPVPSSPLSPRWSWSILWPASSSGWACSATTCAPPGYYGPLEALSLLVLFAGAFSLSQSPLVSGMKGDDETYHEMLSQRVRSKGSRRPASAPAPAPPC